MVCQEGRSIADAVLVLEHGVVRELRDADAVFEHTQAEYTGALLQAHRDWSLETLDREPEVFATGEEP